MKNSHSHFPDVHFTVVFTLFRLTHLVALYLLLSITSTHNNILVSNPETVKRQALIKAEIDEIDLRSTWRSILWLPADRQSNFQAHNSSQTSESQSMLSNSLLNKLFLDQNEKQIAGQILGSKSVQIRKIVSELIPYLSNLLLWQCKLKTCIQNFNNGLASNIENAKLRYELKQGKLFLLKLILLIGSKIIKVFNLDNHNNEGISEQDKQFVRRYYMRVLNLCQGMYKIDSDTIQICKKEISGVLEVDSVCKACSSLSANCSEFLTKLTDYIEVVKSENAINKNIQVKEIIKRFKKLKWVVKEFETKTKGWEHAKLISEKDVIFLNTLKCYTIWKFPDVHINSDENWKNLKKNFKLLHTEISDFVIFVEDHRMLHKQMWQTNELFKIFTESLKEVDDSNLNDEELCLYPKFSMEDIASLKTALIIAERKENNAEWIKKVCDFIQNIGFSHVYLAKEYFPQSFLCLMHSTVVYISREGTPKRPFQSSHCESFLEEFLNKNKLCLRDVIDFYFQLRNLINVRESNEFWLKVLEAQSKRIITDANMKLEVNKARALVIAYYMFKWNFTNLVNLRNFYNKHYCSIKILEELDTESG